MTSVIFNLLVTAIPAEIACGGHYKDFGPRQYMSGRRGEPSAHWPRASEKRCQALLLLHQSFRARPTQTVAPWSRSHRASGKRREASRERLGISREAVWIHETPSGVLAVVCLEADDLQATFAGLGSSQEPFDRWFRELLREVYGIDLAQGFPPPRRRWITGMGAQPSPWPPARARSRWAPPPG